MRRGFAVVLILGATVCTAPRAVESPLYGEAAPTYVHSVTIDSRVELTQDAELACGWDAATRDMLCWDLDRYVIAKQVRAIDQPPPAPVPAR